MKFTDIFIQRPILATVVSLLILTIGFASSLKLPLRQYPKMTNTTITVRTVYAGASPKVMQSFVTELLEQSIATADGIDFLTAESRLGLSTITANIKLNYSPETALTNIIEKVNAVRSQLPRGSEAPTIEKTTGDTFPSAILGFTSDTMDTKQISAYVAHVIRPKLFSVSGLSSIQIWGETPYAMRIWLNPEKMNVFNVTPSEVVAALEANNVLATAGRLKTSYQLFDIQVESDLHNVQQFEDLVVKKVKGSPVRIKNIARVELGAQAYESSVYFNGKSAIFAGVNVVPGANPIPIVKNVRQLMQTLEKNFPAGLKAQVVYDSTIYINAAIKEVLETILGATAIVVIVVFLSLGSLRSTLIPVVAIPLSLIGVCSLMLAMGFSLNLLTLLAMVIAIGLVVDDAIVVLENIHRYVEQGESPFNAAIKGTRQIAIPVIVMTLTLAAVFAPIGFIGGLTGALFTEFAFTLASTVIISGVIALTFSPMLTSKLTKSEREEGRFAKLVNHVFDQIRDKYEKVLTIALENRIAVLVVAGSALLSCYFLYGFTPSELAPQEDQAYIGAIATAPVTANLDYLEHFNPSLQKIYDSIPERKDTFIVNGFPDQNQIIAGLILKPWEERKRSAMTIQPLLQTQLATVSGLQAYAYNPPALPGVEFGLGIQFVITSTQDYRAIYEVSERLKEKIMQSGLFMFAESNLAFDKPEIDIKIDREKAADLGISMQSLISILNSMLSENYVNRFSKQGYSYQVIPQVDRDFRSNVKDLESIQVRTEEGTLVPISSVVSFDRSVQPSKLNRFQQLNAVTLQAMLIPAVSMEQGLKFLEQTAKEILPADMSYDYSGASRQYIQEGNTIMFAFVLSLIIIFLVLAAQFESFRDPLVILISVPMSIFGALVPLFLGAGTINIYTQIGLITLIGLISKHGILMVEFANELQAEENLSIKDAIKKAATVRLRPILMTTAAMVFGVFPLITAQGPGSVSRYDIGLVIASGMAVGTCFTLFVVPIVYSYLARQRSPLKQQ